MCHKPNDPRMLGIPHYTVPVALAHQKYLKFTCRDKLYQYTCVPDGLASTPRIFTKLLKPVFKVLSEKGHLSSSYIDECYLQGDSFDECHVNVQDTTLLFKELDFPTPLKISACTSTDTDIRGFRTEFSHHDCAVNYRT